MGGALGSPRAHGCCMHVHVAMGGALWGEPWEVPGPAACVGGALGSPRAHEPEGHAHIPVAMVEALGSPRAHE